MSAILSVLVVVVAIPMIATGQGGIIEIPELGYEMPGINEQLTPEKRLKIKCIVSSVEYWADLSAGQITWSGFNLDAKEVFSKAMAKKNLNSQDVVLLKVRVLVTEKHITVGNWWFLYIDKKELPSK